MGSLATSVQLRNAGRFADALAALGTSRTSSAQAQVMRAELLERVGRYREAYRLAAELLSSEKLTAGERSACHLVVGRVDSVEGKVHSATASFQRAITEAESANDTARAFWARLRLFVTVSEQAGPDAAVSMLPTLRTTGAKTGDVTVLAALHLFVAQAEAKRGLVRPAARHLQLARPLIENLRNDWLQATLEHLETAVATLRGRLAEALAHGLLALRFSERTGAALGIATAHGNLANLFLLSGKFADAADHQNLASIRLPKTSDNYVAALDLHAQIAICEDRLDDAGA